MTVAIDSNILIYAHNENSNYYNDAKQLLFKLKNENKIGISSISLIEFYQVITDENKMEEEFSEQQCKEVLNSLDRDSNIEILQFNDDVFFNALNSVEEYTISKYEIYDHLIAYIVKSYNINKFYTANREDFEKYDFLDVKNPIIM